MLRDILGQAWSGAQAGAVVGLALGLVYILICAGGVLVRWLDKASRD